MSTRQAHESTQLQRSLKRKLHSRAWPVLIILCMLFGLTALYMQTRTSEEESQYQDIVDSLQDKNT